jgi:hypothetical protein
MEVGRIVVIEEHAHRYPKKISNRRQSVTSKGKLHILDNQNLRPPYGDCNLDIGPHLRYIMRRISLIEGRIPDAI